MRISLQAKIGRTCTFRLASNSCCSSCLARAAIVQRSMAQQPQLLFSIKKTGVYVMSSAHSNCHVVMARPSFSHKFVDVSPQHVMLGRVSGMCPSQQQHMFCGGAAVPKTLLQSFSLLARDDRSCLRFAVMSRL